jgi:MYXO-CTERM domain-containing protein
VGDGQQVGYAFLGSHQSAFLWTGTAASAVDLEPAGATSSAAKGASGGRQIGTIVVGGQNRASLWSGTASSWVDLNPAGAAGSNGLAIGGGQQVGYAVVAGQNHASLWNGTATSWVDLNPTGASSSYAYGVFGGLQVGYAAIGGSSQWHAGLWRGTAASWVDLSASLPANLSLSKAMSIWSDARFIYVAGLANNSASGHYDALLWTAPVPEPGWALLLGLAAFGTRRRRDPQSPMASDS